MLRADDSRRGFLRIFTTLLLGIIGLILIVPAVAYFFGPLFRRSSSSGDSTFHFLDAGPITEFSIGEWRLVNVELVRQNGWEKSRVQRAIWVNRQKEATDSFIVLSPICPHLGCPVNFRQEQRRFICPCHGGTFDFQGHLLSGPPPRNMDSLEYEVRTGRLWVKWQDFKVGVKEQMPVTV